MLAWLNSLFGLFLPIAVVILASGGKQTEMHVESLLHPTLRIFDCCFCTIFTVLWLKWSEVFGVPRVPSQRMFRSTLQALGTSAVMTGAALVYLMPRHSGSARQIALFVFAATLLWTGFQFLIVKGLHSFDADKRRVLILGTGRRASKAWREIRTRQSSFRELVGFVDNQNIDKMAPDIAARFVTEADQLAQFLLKNSVDELLLAVPMRTCYDMAQQCISIASAAGVRVLSLRDIYRHSGSLTSRGRVDPYIELVPQDHSDDPRHSFKRSFDFAVALALLIITAPVFIAICIAVKLSSTGPVFSAEERYGYRLRRFRMYRFRGIKYVAPDARSVFETRSDPANATDEPKVTLIGKWLHRWSLDGLPRLINVVRGEMSLVGPLPLSVADAAHLSNAAAMRRFSRRPGITGIWQFSGSGMSNFDECMELDHHYIDHWSLHLDFKILARTVPAVLKRLRAV
jgi:lipopolysaccharide/colanic/teichoic acid biosynthesis glycosyltransferase